MRRRRPPTQARGRRRRSLGFLPECSRLPAQLGVPSQCLESSSMRRRSTSSAPSPASGIACSAGLYPNRMPVTAVHLMNHDVLPTFETRAPVRCTGRLAPTLVAHRAFRYPHQPSDVAVRTLSVYQALDRYPILPTEPGHAPPPSARTETKPRQGASRPGRQVWMSPWLNSTGVALHPAAGSAKIAAPRGNGHCPGGIRAASGPVLHRWHELTARGDRPAG